MLKIFARNRANIHFKDLVIAYLYICGSNMLISIRKAHVSVCITFIRSKIGYLDETKSTVTKV